MNLLHVEGFLVHFLLPGNSVERLLGCHHIIGPQEETGFIGAK
jgi:hypothetical protein